jgi:two-component system, NarL family, sensor histidine kinase DevS
MTVDSATRAVLDLAQGVLSELELDVVLDRVLESAVQLTGARYAAVGVLSDTKDELARFITRGIDADTRAATGPLPKGRGVLGALIENPRPLRLANVDEHPRSFGFPHGHPPMKSFLGVPILIGGTPFGNLYLTEKVGGREFTATDEQALTVLAEFAGVAIDHARRYMGARERRDELERTVATLEATTQFARAVGGETDIDVILELVAKRGRALVSAQMLLIELIEGDAVLVAAGAGQMPRGLVGQRFPLAGTAADRAMSTGQIHRLDNDLERARFNERGSGRLGAKAECGLVVPLIFRGETYGVLLAINRLDGGPAFAAQDERLLEAFATSAATAVATARSVAVERRRQRLAAAEGERKRWARELHDETLQSLGALRLGLARAEHSGQPRELEDAVHQAIDLLEESIANLRELITDLRPAALDELGAQAAIEALAQRSARHGVEVQMNIDLAFEQGRASTRHVAEVEAALYRIVQEALTNAAKHGEAKQAIVEISEDEATVSVRIRDDGRGFDPSAATAGFGLIGMRERAQVLGGELSIETEPGRGACVQVSIPVMRRVEPAAAMEAKRRRAGKRKRGGVL